MNNIVTLQHRNVIKDGFTVTAEADAGTYPQLLSHVLPDNDAQNPVFLDLPAPWDAVEHAKNALRVRLFSFNVSYLFQYLN